MSNIPIDYADDLNRSAQNINSDVMAKLILAYQKNIANIEDDTIIDNLFISSLIDQHNVFSEFGRNSIEGNDKDGHLTISGYNIKQPKIFRTDPLTYDLTGASNLRFAFPNIAESTKFNAGAFIETTQRIGIEQNPNLDFTNGFTVAFWIYKPFSPITGFTQYLLADGTAFSTSGQNIFLFASGIYTTLYRTNGTSISFGAATPVGWTHIAIIYNANNNQSIQMYRNGVFTNERTSIPAIKSPETGFSMLSRYSSFQPLATGTGVAWFTYCKGTPTGDPATWALNDFNGIRDLSNMQEIISFSFAGHAKPQPPQTTGTMYSNTAN